MPNDLRFLRCVTLVAAKHDHIPLLHVIEIVRATLAEVDAITCDEIELAAAFHNEGLNPGTAAA
jgi:hypothetical protein